MTMVWIEDDMQMIADVADRIQLLDYGRAIAEGPLRKSWPIQSAYSLSWSRRALMSAQTKRVLEEALVSARIWFSPEWNKADV
jgi:ABC-type glutathione transport system ATPase component